MRCTKKITKSAILFNLLFLSASTYASVADMYYSSSYHDANESWRPFITFGGGSAISLKTGETNYFPIRNPVSDSYYNYHAERKTQTASFFNFYLGLERGLPYPNWGVDLGFGYYQTGVFPIKGTLVQGADVPSQDTYEYQYKALSREYMLEARVLYNYYNTLLPYMSFGAGFSNNKSYAFSTNVPPTLTFTRNYTSEEYTTPSYSIGLGVDTYLSKEFRVGVGYRFANLGKLKLGSSTIDNVNTYGTLIQSNLYVNELYGQLVYVIG